MPAPPSFEARIVSRRMVSPGVFELGFERCDGTPIAFEAGQWVSLTLPIDGGEIKRSYSVASPPNGSPRFDLAITLVAGGPGSNVLFHASLGTVLRVIGPQGFFTRTAHPHAPSLFIATGTGLTPFRSMILEATLDASKPARSSKITAETWLLFGARTEEDLIYREELEKAAQTNALFHVEYTLSRGADAWTGRRGYVQTHVRELWEKLAVHGPPHAYICGLEKMVSAVRTLLREEMQVPRQQVHSERYD